MRTFLSREYFPFGTQYYRAPSPRPSEWEGDLEHMAKLGLTMVKFWVQWRWNAPRPGAYDFSDIDRLMDLAQENGLRVMLNTIVDVAPAWIYRRYPDAPMLTMDGRRVGPQTQPHRQIGGLGLCFNHRAAMDHMFDFLQTTVRRYKSHPALELWNVASEPELTSSMAEMRLYADDANRMGDMLCYCGHCRRAFRRWLRDKYTRIDALNLAWNRNYTGFDEVEIPITRNSFNDIIDWRMFFVHTLGENVRRRFEVAKKEDNGKHGLMCHHVFIQGFPVTSTANDPWNVGRFGDIHGITQMDDPMMCDVLRSCARGKPVISAEMLMQYGYTLDLPKPVALNDIKRYVFTGIAANLKGFIYWQFRPETLAREAPAWGLTFLDGTSTPWLKGFVEVNRVLQKNAGFLLDAVPPSAHVALLYSPENQIFGWAATGSEKTVTDSILGTHRALYSYNITIDIVHRKEIEAGILEKYRVLVVPFPYFLSAATCTVIEAWVSKGGVVIGECYFAGWHEEEGRHQTTVPGYGLEEVFGAKQGIVAPGEAVPFKTTKALPYLRKGATIVGTLVKEQLIPSGAEVLARFPDGQAAVTSCQYGKGRAILIGSYIAFPFYRNGYAPNAALLASLVTMTGALKGPRATPEGAIRADVLTASGKRMVILRNLRTTPVVGSVTIPGPPLQTMREQFGEDKLRFAEVKGGSRARVRLAAAEVKVYCD